MSLADFQRAFAVVVLDPMAWARRLEADGAPVGDLCLTAAEVERLKRILRHPKMGANHLLLRANRMMPLRGALPLTCDWLGPQFDAVLDEWLRSGNDASVQYAREAERFAIWLPGFFDRAGLVPHPALDALAYERGLANLVAQALASVPDPVVELRFVYDPDLILDGMQVGVDPLPEPIGARLCVVEGMVALDRGPTVPRPPSMHAE